MWCLVLTTAITIDHKHPLNVFDTCQRAECRALLTTAVTFTSTAGCCSRTYTTGVLPIMAASISGVHDTCRELEAPIYGGKQPTWAFGVKQALPWRVLQKQKQQNEQKTAVNFAQNFGGFVRADCERQLLQGVWHPANPSQLGPIP